MDPRALLEPKKASKTGKASNAKSQKVGNDKSSTNGGPSATPSTPSRSTTQTSTKLAQTSPTTLRTFDPRALLNPRGQKATARPESMDAGSGEAADGANGINGAGLTSNGSAASGFGLLEQLHGTEKRVAERPVKRLKTDHPPNDEDQHAGQAKGGSSRHGNQGVGLYFKPKTDANEAGTTMPPISIDLTNDDDEDDDGLQITDVRNLEDKEVCYGMIDGYIQAHKVPQPMQPTSKFAPHQWPVFKVVVSRNVKRDIRIECIDPHGVMFGLIEEQLSHALAPAMDGFPRLRVQCRLLSRGKKPHEVAHDPCSDRYRMVINLYGRKGDVDKVGRWFGQKNTWFKSPMISDPGIEVINPHSFKKAAQQQKALYGPKQVVNTTRTAEEATDAVSKLFDYQAEEGNEIPETEAPRTITTTLLPHQKQALTFMYKQEQPRTFATDGGESGNSSLWRKMPDARGRMEYEEIVTGMKVHEEPAQSLGGLLADVMGLGKTIQALALIAGTAAEATNFGHQQVTRAVQGEDDIKCNSRATLLVVPLSTVKNWEDQIKEHTTSASMLYHVYHGLSRKKQVYTLADNDVVITTYGTAASEICNKKETNTTSPLCQIRWFRVILDEAHTIRESRSSQARAMYSLHAERRWCLTGTPIQNRMEDLGSLTTFLRLFPYDSAGRFKQYVQAPATSGDPNFLKRLRVFVDSFTLRRLRDRIHLPPREDLTVSLEFSAPERNLHDFFRDKFSVALKEMGKENKREGTGAQYHRVLQGITILRLICDHGKELLKEDQLEDYKGNAPEDAIDVDEERPPADITKQKAYEHFNMMIEGDADFCNKCGKKFTGESPGSETNDYLEGPTDITQAVVLPCFDVLCTDCFKPYRPIFDAGQPGDSLTCDSCLMPIRPTYIPIKKTRPDEQQVAPDDKVQDKSLFKNGFYSGPHTKTKALLSDIATMREESHVLEANGEPPLKCVVFSEFTSHLDLLEKALSDAGLAHSFARIDGSMSLTKRRKVLDALNSDDTTTILLASIKAAGQGLNLTAASRAFIMEPMWNPAAESQAVDRIYRIGQHRPVLVKRYRMVDSMEDKIVDLQQKKKRLAEMSMEKATMQKALGKKERNEQSLKQMMDLFK